MNNSFVGIIDDLDREGFGYVKRAWNTYQYFKKHGFRRPFGPDQAVPRIPFHKEMDRIHAENDRILSNAAAYRKRNAKPRGYYPAGYRQRPVSRTVSRYRSRRRYPSRVTKLTRPYRRRFRYYISRRTPTLYNYNRRTRWFAGKVRTPVKSYRYPRKRNAVLFRRRRRF